MIFLPIEKRRTIGSVARHLVFGTAALCALLATNGPAAADATLDALDPAAVEALRRGEAVLIMRHALAPGTGDPANFERGDCGTQRNLSDAGRAQARAIGERLTTLLDGREAEVYSSAWCRCLDTARLLGVGPVEPLPALDSFFRERGREDEQTSELTDWIAERLDGAPKRAPAVLVSHQVNVTALSGVFPASGETLIVALEEGAAEVLATFTTNVPDETMERRD